MIKLPCPKCGHSFALRLDAAAPFSCPIKPRIVSGVERAVK